MAQSQARTGAQHPQHVWVEAENMGPLAGANFSFQQEAVQTKGSWSVSGPGVAAEWTQGGESEFMSIAARADAPAGQSVARDIEIPVAGRYFLWVRYADYRQKKEEFGVRITQGGKKSEHVFGRTPVVDEMETMKLRWDWAFGWDSAAVELGAGPARLELYSTGPTGARRQVDAIALTTDASYRPTGREKPNFAAWQTLRGFEYGAPSVPEKLFSVAQNKSARPTFMWNVREQWLGQLNKPAAERVEAPFEVDPSLVPAFTAAYAGKQPEIYSHALSGPTIYINDYPAAFKTGSEFLQWLERNPAQQFTILLNYGTPAWPQGTTDADKRAVYANFQRFKDRFIGYISGESIGNISYDAPGMEARIRAARSRAEVLAAMRDVYTAGTAAKYTDLYGQPVPLSEAWGPVLVSFSVKMEPFAHAIANWGSRRLGYESNGNSPSLSRSLAFLRGASRQFGTGLFDYQSANLGDSATMFSRDRYIYPASSRFVLDNSYDVWAGAGVNWLLKDYLLWHVAGADSFYNEQGMDMFWKPGGSAAGDDFPVQLSPKGKVAEAVQKIAAAHPRGTQYTPVALLLDEAHGYLQDRFEPGAFGLNPAWNPKVLSYDRHQASIRGWMDVAFYPMPETQNEPASGVRQTYVNGVFGDIFDVIVSTPQKSAIVKSYPVVVAAGEVNLSADWGAALRDYLQNGGTLVVSADQFIGAGAGVLGLPQWGATREAASVTWKEGNQQVGSNVFRYRALNGTGNDRILASAPNGDALCLERKIGRGRLIIMAMPLALGINERPTPLSGLVMRHVTARVLPVTVNGDVQWALNKLDDGGWLVTILNNRGVIKPQHGVLPTDYKQAQSVTIRSASPVKSSREWMTESNVAWQGASTRITIPAGAARMVELRP